MTQTSTLPAAPATDDIAVYRAWSEALLAADGIPTTGGQPSVISGAPTARFGALIKIDHEIRHGDARGTWLLGATKGQTYCEPADALTVLTRMLAEGREIFAVEALRGMLGGTTRV